MKELKKIKLSNYTPLSDNQMRDIRGMASRSDCVARCHNGCPDVTIEDCNGTCVATDYEGVTCYGPTAILTKPCCGTGY